MSHYAVSYCYIKAIILGLRSGFLSFLVNTIFISVGYLCLVLCLAELTSITNFAGGTYGYSRCSLGPSYGFVFGCCELLASNFFTMAHVHDIATAVTFGFKWSTDVEPIAALICYILLTSVHFRGGPYFWYSVTGFAVVTILLVLLYLISAMVMCHFIYKETLGQRDRGGFHEDFTGLMAGMMYAAW